jgi:hypothetical protein
MFLVRCCIRIFLLSTIICEKISVFAFIISVDPLKRILATDACTGANPVETAKRLSTSTSTINRLAMLDSKGEDDIHPEGQSTHLQTAGEEPQYQSVFLNDEKADDSAGPQNNNGNDTSAENVEGTTYGIDDKPRYRSNFQFLRNEDKGGEADEATRLNTKNSIGKGTDVSKEGKKTSGDEPKPSSNDMDPEANADADAPATERRSQPQPQLINEEYSIDSFLNGEYDRPFSEDAAAPHPGLSPQETIEAAVHALRNLNEPNQNHGAAVFSRFLVPLTRSERWGGSVSGTLCPWKEMMRGALTPTMLARRIRASKEFSVLLDWESVDVTEGLYVPGLIEAVGSTVAFVNAALYFSSSGIEPFLIQFALRKVSGVWLIDSAVISKREWFIAADDKRGT